MKKITLSIIIFALLNFTLHVQPEISHNNIVEVRMWKGKQSNTITYHAHLKNGNEITSVKFQNGKITTTLTKKIGNIESNKEPEEFNYPKPFPIYNFLEQVFEEKRLEQQEVKQNSFDQKEQRRRAYQRRQKQKNKKQLALLTKQARN